MNRPARRFIHSALAFATLIPNFTLGLTPCERVDCLAVNTEGANLPANLSGAMYRAAGPLWKED